MNKSSANIILTIEYISFLNITAIILALTKRLKCKMIAKIEQDKEKRY